MKIKILTVSKLNAYIKKLLDNDVILSNVSVQGELSNVKIHSSGHMYFSLKDPQGVISCVMFKSNTALLNFTPVDGSEVILAGYVGLYEKTGLHQLYVQQMKMHGEGNLYQKFERLKEDLKKRGWFDASSKKSIPHFPKRIAIITSETGAALQDILSVLRRRNPSVCIYLFPVLVQGDKAKFEISKAIENVNNGNYADVIILGRGGGSIEELWAFNEEMVAQSIFNSRLPIISAIGHETDFTIADFVADLRAPTPSAAAEVATNSLMELKDRLYVQKNRLSREMIGLLQNHRKKLGEFQNTHVIKRPLERVNKYRLQLDYMQNTVKTGMYKKFQDQRVRLLHAKTKLNVVAPKDGIGKVFNANGDEILSIKMVQHGDEIDILLKDGLIRSKIIEIVEGEEI
ncbi:MAG: exodeoxyribonuclease VII large subunit [Eubacteriales bacterium]